MVKPKKHGGRRPGSGRKPGSPNKIPGTVKMMVLEALEKLGGVKYLMQQAKDNPTAFMTLLGRVMPTQVVGDVNHRYVALMPPPEGSTETWLKKYAPPQTQQTKH